MAQQTAKERVRRQWARLWLALAGRGAFARTASRIAAWGVPPLYGRTALACLSRHGFRDPTARVYHERFRCGEQVLLDEGVLIYQDAEGGEVALGDRVRLYRDTVIQTGAGGSVQIGARSAIQPRCQLSAYKAAIRIGDGVQIAPNCGFYPYDHGTDSGREIRNQPLTSRGDIVIEDEAWIGFGVVVLSGVRIGRGAVVGAGSVVTRDVPAGAIAGGSPARVLRTRAAGADDATAREGQPQPVRNQG